MNDNDQRMLGNCTSNSTVRMSIIYGYSCCFSFLHSPGCIHRGTRNDGGNLFQDECAYIHVRSVKHDVAACPARVFTLCYSGACVLCQSPRPCAKIMAFDLSKVLFMQVDSQSIRSQPL